MSISITIDGFTIATNNGNLSSLRSIEVYNIDKKLREKYTKDIQANIINEVDKKLPPAYIVIYNKVDSDKAPCFDGIKTMCSYKSSFTKLTIEGPNNFKYETEKMETLYFVPVLRNMSYFVLSQINMKKGNNVNPIINLRQIIAKDSSGNCIKLTNNDIFVSSSYTAETNFSKSNLLSNNCATIDNKMFSTDTAFTGYNGFIDHKPKIVIINNLNRQNTDTVRNNLISNIEIHNRQQNLQERLENADLSYFIGLENKWNQTLTESKNDYKYNSFPFDYDVLEAENTTLKNENTRLTDENTTLKNENTRLTDENTTLKNENTTLKNENTRLKNLKNTTDKVVDKIVSQSRRK
jgi:hypothetical protein